MAVLSHCHMSLRFNSKIPAKNIALYLLCIDTAQKDIGFLPPECYLDFEVAIAIQFDIKEEIWVL